MELLERNLLTVELHEKSISSPPLRLSPRRSQRANQRARSDLVSEFNSIYIGFFFLYASYPIGTGFCSSLVLYVNTVQCCIVRGVKQVNSSENHVICVISVQ